MTIRALNKHMKIDRIPITKSITITKSPRNHLTNEDNRFIMVKKA